MSGKLSIVILSLWLAGCAVQPTHPTLKSSDLPRLLPVRDFAANIHYQGFYRISPDGKRLAWKAVAGTREEIFVRTVGRQDTRSLDFGAQGLHFVWARDSRRILFSRDAGGNENFHLFAADTDHPEDPPVDLTPHPNTQVHIQQLIDDDPDHVLVVHNARDTAVFDLYRLNLNTGEERLVYRNDENIIRLVTDKQGRLQARVRQDGEQRFLERPGEQGWRTVLQWNVFDTVHPLTVTPDGSAIWLLSNIGTDKVALYRLVLDSAKLEFVYGHPTVDVGHVLMSQEGEQPLLAHFQPDYPRIEVLDERLHDMIARFRKAEPAQIQVTSMDRQEQRFTVRLKTDVGEEAWLVDLPSGEFERIGNSYTQAFQDALAPMKPVRIRSRDGLTLHGYLTRAKGLAAPAPMVLLVHGGPFGRDRWGYNRLPQFLANRGYAVLQLNYRGSAGYGRGFMDAATGEFGRRMHDDLIDGVNWAVQQGIADPARIAIMGGSFGGYATLVGMTRTPEVFACGVDIVGPADLVSLTENFPVYWRPFMHRWIKAAGDPKDPQDRAMMRERSPVYFADRVKGPLLIIQGANDVRVKQGQSDRMVAALREHGKRVDYMLIEGEGHRIRHWKNRLKMYRETEDFLAGCLGGRSAGFDYYQLGSWLF